MDLIFSPLGACPRRHPGVLDLVHPDLHRGGHSRQLGEIMRTPMVLRVSGHSLLPMAVLLFRLAGLLKLLHRDTLALLNHPDTKTLLDRPDTLALVDRPDTLALTHHPGR